MNWLRSRKEKGILILLSLSFVFSLAAIMHFNPPFLREWMIKLEDNNYDRQVRRYHKPLPPHPSIAIVAIDDKSLLEEGRWPWDRAKVARLTAQLSQMGASVVAIDAVFSELEENPVDAVLKVVKNPALAKELEEIKPELERDSLFENSLKMGRCVLGFAFASDGKKEGILPPPLLTLSKSDEGKSLIPSMNGYIGNQPLFQRAAGQGGFINAMFDSDGIMRFAPLLMREGENVYPSLALQAAKSFLALPFVGMTAIDAGQNQAIEAIQLGNISIPTDPWGRILIPFRGPPYTFPYLSASDLLHGRIARDQVEGKLIFIGVSATGSSDLISAAISPAFPGVEIQATIASGIIDHYLPYKPDWGRADAIALVLILGTIAAFSFPYIGRVAAFLVSLLIIFILEGVNYWIWTRYNMVLSFFFPMPTLATIFILDLLTVYIGDKEQKKEIRRILGQSVQPETLELLIRKKGEYTLASESKELSFLFADIWNFPALSEPMSAASLKEFLNLYFTQINRVIFEKKGVIDKYVRDEAIAFWGAPLPEENRASLSVAAALAIQACLPALNRQFESEGKPPIQVGIGIGMGTVHVGDMGSKLHRSYTAIGYAADLALHLKSLTSHYSVGILVDESIWRETKELFSYREIDQIPFRGKTERIYGPITSVPEPS